MRPTRPEDNESVFDLSELFFSRTDDRGIIQFGNDIFVRVSGYTKQELLNAPHNIIRHPDMPRVVFRYFWDTLKSGLPIGAYVKNMSKDGSYYWVFAAVWKTESGYLSLRLKPTSPLLGTVAKLYDTLRIEEKTKSPEVALQILAESIRSLGFGDYREFMATALVQELLSRENLLSRIDSTAGNPSYPSRIKDMHRHGAGAGENYSHIFGILIEFKGLCNEIGKKADQILGIYKTIEHLSINMSIESERIGANGRTISEVSSGFKTVADEVKSSIETFRYSMDDIRETISRSQFEIGGARLQIEIIQSFIREEFEGHKELSEERLSDFLSNFETLHELAARSAASVATNLFELRKRLHSMLERCDELRVAINGLEVIRVSAKIEASNIASEHRVVLTTYISQMSDFIRDVTVPLRQTRAHASEFGAKAYQASGSLEAAREHLTRLRSATMALELEPA